MHLLCLSMLSMKMVSHWSALSLLQVLVTLKKKPLALKMWCHFLCKTCLLSAVPIINAQPIGQSLWLPTAI